MRAARALFFVLAGASALLLASEGILSLGFGRSWRVLVARSEAPLLGLELGRERLTPEETRAAFEVRLEPRDWVVVTLRGESVVAAARLVELESLP